MPELADSAAADEPALVRRAAGGDMVAFEELVMRHADRLYAALRSYGLDDGEAQEVAQETFIRAWRSLDRFEGRSAFFTWLYRIGFNEAHRQLGRRRPAGAVVPLDASPAHEIVDGRPDPADRAEHSEHLAALAKALHELPVNLRAPVVLRDVEGLSTDEAASVLDLGEAAFKSRLHRGRLALRAVVGQGPWGPPEPG